MIKKGSNFIFVVITTEMNKIIVYNQITVKNIYFTQNDKRNKNHLLENSAEICCSTDLIHEKSERDVKYDP